MKKLNIIIENDIIVSSVTKNISSTFYIDYQGKSFPDNQWTDLTDAVLGMWEHNLLQHQISSSTKFPLYFMDGPFRLDVIKDDKQQLTVNCISGKSKVEQVDFTFQCSYYDFLYAVHEANKKLSYFLYINNMHEGNHSGLYKQALANMQNLKKAMSKEKQAL